MAKVGLKDTLKLMAAGYSKKEIDALAAIDEEQEKDHDPAPEDKKDTEPDPAPAPEDKKDTEPDPAPAPEDKNDPEPDYKEMYEQLAKENKETKAKLTKLQQANVHKDSTEDSEKAKQEQYDSLLTTVRGFM